jgi:pyruvate/2-oxoglutarate dehydrogenase complex dihydrolipoamide dehydrogenase (E3) component
MTNTDFDVIVLGAGPAGEVAAGRLVSHGLSVAVVERELAGGECSYWACIPSKSLLHPAAALHKAQRVPGAAQAVTGKLDAEAVFAKRNEMISNFDDSSQVSWIEGEGIEFVRGQARLDGDRVVVVTKPDGDETRLYAQKAVIVATGSSASVPPIDGLNGIDYWTSREATTANSVPGSLAIVGGGVVAVEMASAWNSLGSSVTLLVRGDRLIEREEPFASDLLADALTNAGIDVRLNCEASRVENSANGITVHVSNGEAVETERLLVAAGRRPNTADLGLDSVGLEPGKAIEVDDQLRAKGIDSGWLYAVGDAAGRSLLTHMGKYQATLAADHIGGHKVEAWADHHAVPGVIFTNPQVASVGIKLHDARLAGLDAKEVRVPLNSVAATSIDGAPEGSAQLVVDQDRRVIVGATFVGPEVADLAYAATVAIVGEVPIDRLRHAVPAFPAQSELWLRLIEAYGL